MTTTPRLGRRARLGVLLLAGASLAACASVQPRYPSHAAGAHPPPGGSTSYKVGKPYQVAGVWYVPREQPDYDETGVASWYGEAFDQKPTASGEMFDMYAASAAHTTLPLPSLVEVTNLDNGRKLVVRVNDRGPFVGGRIIDLSYEAARELGYDHAGLARVRVRYVGRAPLLGPEAGVRYAAAKAPPVPVQPRAAAAAAPPPPPPPPPPADDGADATVVLAEAAPAPPPVPIDTAALAPVTGAALAGPPIEGQGPTVARRSPLRIQAGAFSSETNAQRAVAQLAAAGSATIELVQRNGAVLYRVVMPAPSDEAAAYALRDRVAAIGFEDARVVQAF
jgi:rare lipoprotein A